MDLFFLIPVLCVYEWWQRQNGNYIETAIVVTVGLIDLFCVQLEKPRKMQTSHILIVSNVRLSRIVIIIVVFVINVHAHSFKVGSMNSELKPTGVTKPQTLWKGPNEHSNRSAINEILAWTRATPR